MRKLLPAWVFGVNTVAVMAQEAARQQPRRSLAEGLVRQRIGV